MYEEDVLNNEAYGPFFPTYEMKYLAMERRPKLTSNLITIEVRFADQAEEINGQLGMTQEDPQDRRPGSPDLFSEPQELLGKRREQSSEPLRRETDMMNILDDLNFDASSLGYQGEQDSASGHLSSLEESYEWGFSKMRNKYD